MAAALGRTRDSFNTSPPSSATQLSWPQTSLPFGAAGAFGSFQHANQMHIHSGMAEQDIRGRKRNATLPSSSTAPSIMPRLSHGGSEYMSLDTSAGLSSESGSESLSTSPFQGSDASLADADYPAWMQQSPHEMVGGWHSAFAGSGFTSAVNGNSLGALASLPGSAQSPNIARADSWQSPPFGFTNSTYPASVQDEIEIKRRSSSGDARRTYALHSPSRLGLNLLDGEHGGLRSSEHPGNPYLQLQHGPQGQSQEPDRLLQPHQPNAQLSLSPNAMGLDASLQHTPSLSQFPSAGQHTWQSSSHLTTNGKLGGLHSSASSPNLAGRGMTSGFSGDRAASGALDPVQAPRSASLLVGSSSNAAGTHQGSGLAAHEGDFSLSSPLHTFGQLTPSPAPPLNLASSHILPGVSLSHSPLPGDSSLPLQWPHGMASRGSDDAAGQLDGGNAAGSEDLVPELLSLPQANLFTSGEASNSQQQSHAFGTAGPGFPTSQPLVPPVDPNGTPMAGTDGAVERLLPPNYASGQGLQWMGLG